MLDASQPGVDGTAGHVTPSTVIIRVESVDGVSEEGACAARTAVPPGPAGLAPHLSCSLLELPLPRHALRRHSEPWDTELENQAFRLSLFLNDPEPGGRRRRGARSGGRSRRHSTTPSPAGERPGSSSVSSRSSRRRSASSGSRRRSSATSAGAAGRRRSSATVRGGAGVAAVAGGRAALADLLPSAAPTPKERRRRRAVLATLAGTGLLLLLAVGLVLGTLHLSGIRPPAPFIHVRRENDEIYNRGLGIGVNASTTTDVTELTPTSPPLDG